MLPELDGKVVSEMYEVMRRGRSLGQSGQLSEAEKLFNEAWDMMPEPKLGWDSSQLMAGHFARLYRDIGSFQVAENFVAHVFSCNPASGDGDPFFLKGTVLYESGRVDEAKLAFKQALDVAGRRPFDDNEKYLALALD